jgi:hypothetical protein
MPGIIYLGMWIHKKPDGWQVEKGTDRFGSLEKAKAAIRTKAAKRQTQDRKRAYKVTPGAKRKRKK